MKTTTLTIVVAAIVCSLAVGIAIYEVRQARGAMAALVSAHRAAMEQVRALEARVVEVARSRVSAEPVAAKIGPSATDSAPAVEVASQPRKARSFSELMQDPSYAAGWRRQIGRDLDRMHADVYIRLNLDPARRARLKDLLVTREEIRREAVSVARAAGMNDAEVKQASKQARQGTIVEIRQLIGDAGYAELELNEKTYIPRQMMEHAFAIELKAADMPLSADQLTNTASTTLEYWEAAWQQKGIGFSGFSHFTDPLEADAQTGLTPHGKALLERYAEYLTPAQLNAVKGILVENTKWRELTQKR